MPAGTASASRHRTFWHFVPATLAMVVILCLLAVYRLAAPEFAEFLAISGLEIPALTRLSVFHHQVVAIAMALPVAACVALGVTHLMLARRAVTWAFRIATTATALLLLALIAAFYLPLLTLGTSL